MEENQNIQQPTVQYTEDNVIHLSDMEHVRTRPGMYIGRLGDGSHAEDGIYVLLKEVIDNSIDEFKMNAGKRIEVTVEDNLRCTIRDYGRGIPQGKLVEAVSMLNTGGKYDSKAFKKSVGLNGVGLKAVNALSRHFEARSYRDGQVRSTTFECGKLITDVTEPTDDETGTYIYFEPDPSLFKHYSFRGEFVEEMLRNYTYLNTGLTIMFNGRRILSRNGLSDLLTDRMTATALYDIVHLKGEDIEIAFTHCNQNGEEYYSFVNGQHTTLGGTHQAAFKKYIAEVIKEYSGKNYDYSDIRNGMVAAISINIQEPLFESQTKIKLGSLTTEPDGGISIDKFIGDFVKSQVDNFLHKNTDVAEVILQKVSESERERKAMAGVAKKAREMSKKANLHNRKLRDCRIHLNDAKGDRQEESCIFITEGDSASGSITKLVNNMVAGAYLSAIAEGYAFAAKAGIDLQTTFDATRCGFAGGPLYDNKVPKIIHRDYEPGARIAVHLKDIHNAKHFAHKLGVDTPVTDITMQIMEWMGDNGYIDIDQAGMVKYFEAKMDVKVGSEDK